jgi:hypothetical protein
MKKITAVLILLAASACGPSDAEKAVTHGEEMMAKAHQQREEAARRELGLADYQALQKGMTYEDVVKRKGPGKEVGRKMEYSLELVTYRWEAQPGYGGSPPGWMELTFRDGKLVEGKQEGLR